MTFGDAGWSFAERVLLNVEPLKATDVNVLAALAYTVAEFSQTANTLSTSPPSRVRFVTKTLKNGLIRTQVREPRPFGILSPAWKTT